ncbi:MAG: hydrogenase expression protein, partial [Caldilineaceae bacterium SB0665_bin_25]|nr:hydrogenase expression protein [Caldilineaceae bacterium SB0665_bin_25]
FGLDPLGTIASGGLLAAAAPENVDAVLALWRRMGREGRVIGRVLAAEEGVYGLREGRRVALPQFSADEIVKLWGE